MCSKEIRADYTIRSSFTQRDALEIAIDGHFDKIANFLKRLDYIKS